MLKSGAFILTILLTLSFASCKPSVTPEKLYGKWNYIKVEDPNANPPDSVKKTELEEQAPYILFSKNNDVVIVWGGKLLSHGKFRLDGSNIRFKEILADGKNKGISVLCFHINR